MKKMKIITLVLLAISALITSCDRDTLSGLKVKVDAEVETGYDNDKDSTKTVVETKQSVTTEVSDNRTIEIENKTEPVATKSTSKITKEPDPDQPMAFNQITNCSTAGIRAKTNEIFYSENSQVKSIDSKNKEQVKAWKKIYQKIEAQCES